jgi:hypothetical protein
MPEFPGKTINVSAVSVMRGMKFNLKLTRAKEAKIRLWIAIRLIKCAARMINASVEVERS